MDRDEEGRFSPTHTDADVLDAVDANAPAATAEVAEALDVTRQAADYRLRQLREAGRVESKYIGSALAWSLADASQTEERDEEEGPPTSRPEHDPIDTGGRTARYPLREAVDAVDLEGGGAVVEARRDALVDVLAYLREEGSATAAELKDVIDDEDDRLYADADSFWTNMRRQNVLDELDPLGKPGKGGKRYYWKG